MPRDGVTKRGVGHELDGWPAQPKINKEVWQAEAGKVKDQNIKCTGKHFLLNFFTAIISLLPWSIIGQPDCLGGGVLPKQPARMPRPTSFSNTGSSSATGS